MFVTGESVDDGDVVVVVLFVDLLCIFSDLEGLGWIGEGEDTSNELPRVYLSFDTGSNVVYNFCCCLFSLLFCFSALLFS